MRLPQPLPAAADAVRPARPRAQAAVRRPDRRAGDRLAIGLLPLAGGEAFEETLVRRGFQTANALAGGQLFTLADVTAGAAGPALDCLFVLAPWDSAGLSRRDRVRLRAAAHRARATVGIGAGALALHTAGLLDGAEIAVPWAERAKVRELHPQAVFPDAACIWHGRTASCVGRVATLDAVLACIDRCAGRPALARETAAALLYPGPGTAGVTPAPAGGGASCHRAAFASRLTRLLRDNIEQPLTTAAIAARLHKSPRAVQRSALRELGCTVMAYYRRIRLEHAHWLLGATDRPISEIALAAGFPSHAAFSRSYRAHYGRSPTAARKGAAA